MRIRVLTSVLLLLCGCTRSDTAVTNIAVSNMSVGLIREGADGFWHVYSRGDTFPLEPNGTCEVEGKMRECMWYGIEFDYAPASAKLNLICTATFNKKTDVFDPQRESAPKAETTTFEIPLESANGHMAMPAAVFREPDDTRAPWMVKVACGHHGHELLRYTFTALHEA
jgi:hypothetical protein